MVEVINQVTRAVRDLEWSFAFYTEVLIIRAAARWDRGAHLTSGDDWLALILDPNVRGGPLPEYTHLALSVPPVSFEEVSERVAEPGAKVWQSDSTPGRSLYFLDPDGHKLEIHASDLPRRIEADRRSPPPGMVFFD